MKPGCALVVLVVVGIAAVAAVGVGAHNHRGGGGPTTEELQDHPPSFAGAIDSLTDWAAPKLDPRQVRVNGAALADDRRVTVPPLHGPALTIRVLPADATTRRLRLRLVEPAPTALPLVQVDYAADRPLPERVAEDDLPKRTALPNPKPGSGRDARDLTLPVYRAGATVTLTGLGPRACVVELR
jgi:hypothetical protein